MPKTRGNMDTSVYPDTKIPRAVFPDIRGDYELNNVIVMLNMGEHDSHKHYAAIAKIRQLHKYVLFYRSIGGTWSVVNMRALKKNLFDSLSMLDDSRALHRVIEKVVGIAPKQNTTRKRTPKKGRRRRRRRTLGRTARRRRRTAATN